MNRGAEDREIASSATLVAAISGVHPAPLAIDICKYFGCSQVRASQIRSSTGGSIATSR